MKNARTIVFVTLMATAIALVTVSAYALFYNGNNVTTVYPPNADNSATYGNYPNGMMGGYMGGMMGSDMWSNWMNGSPGSSSSVQSPATAQNAIYTTVGIAALVGAVISGTGGLAYFVLASKTRITEIANAKTNPAENSPAKTAVTPYMSISKTLTNEERQVLDVLVSHDGKYLQKYIRAETGLSRLKTHRIVARLAERGIVALEKSGNTNEVRLSSWLQNSMFEHDNHQTEKISILV